MVIAARNLTAGKSSTLFGIFVAHRLKQYTGTQDRRRGVERRARTVAQTGPALRCRPRRRTGRRIRQGQPARSTDGLGPRWPSVHRRQYSLDVTLAGDVNGDGTVNQADLAPFASAYLTSAGGKGFNAAADFNQDGIVNQIDAKALEENMPPVKRSPLQLLMNLLPADVANYPTPKNSGARTVRKDVTVVGRTLPGSIVIQDGTAGYYKWVGPAYATDSSGFFEAKEKLTQGINTFDFLVIDPVGRQLIRSYPIFWLPFAASGSKLK